MTTETGMTEKHNVHLAPNDFAEMIRANCPKLGIAEVLNVIPLRVAGQGRGNQNPPLLRRRG